MPFCLHSQLDRAAGLFKIRPGADSGPGEGSSLRPLRLSLSLCAGVSLLLLPLGLFARPIAAYFFRVFPINGYLIAPATLCCKGFTPPLWGANLKLQNTGAICRANVTRGWLSPEDNPSLSSWGQRGASALGHILAYGAACFPLCQGACSLFGKRWRGSPSPLAGQPDFPLYTLPGSLLGNPRLTVWRGGLCCPPLFRQGPGELFLGGLAPLGPYFFGVLPVGQAIASPGRGRAPCQR